MAASPVYPRPADRISTTSGDSNRRKDFAGRDPVGERENLQIKQGLQTAALSILSACYRNGDACFHGLRYAVRADLAIHET